MACRSFSTVLFSNLPVSCILISRCVLLTPEKNSPDPRHQLKFHWSALQQLRPPSRNYRTAPWEYHEKHIIKDLDHVILNLSEPECFLCSDCFFLPLFLCLL